MKVLGLLKNHKKVVLLGLLLIIALYVYIKPNHLGPILPCVFNKVTGLYCPGCGMSRAFNAAAHFEFYQSFRYNALIYILGPMLLIEFILRKRKKNTQTITILMLCIALLYGVLRNIHTFSFLAPTIIK